MNRLYTALTPYLLTILLTTLCPNTHANATQTEQASAKDQAYNPKLELVAALGKKVLGSFLDLNYHLSQEITITLPLVGKEITINWGFGGAGDIFSPFPGTPVRIQSTTDSANPITLDDLALELGKDYVVEKALEQAHGIELLKWIIQGKLKPVNLFFIKLLLLVKEGTHETEPHYIEAELFRLMMRLSLTDNNGAFDTNQPISSYLPKFMRTYIDALAPGLLATMDTWQNQLGSSMPHGTSTTRSLSIFALSDKKAAGAFYQAMQQAGPANRGAAIDSYIEQSFIKTIEYEDFAALSKTDFMIISADGTKPPASLGLTKNMVGTATFTSDASGTWNNNTDLPQVVKDKLKSLTRDQALMLITVNPHEYWICSLAPHEDISHNILLMGNAFVQAFKEYNTIRKTQFKNNPQEAIDYQHSWNERERHKGLIKAFLKTKPGKDSTQRLNSSIGSIKALSSIGAQDSFEQDTLNEQITTLEEARTHAQQMLAQLEQIARGTHTKAVARIQDEINDLTQRIAQLEAEKSLIKPAMTQASAFSPATIAQQRKTLHELQILVKRLKIQGMPIPQDLTDQISILQKNVGNLGVDTASTIMPLGKRLAIRHAIASAYQEEAYTIQATLNEQLSAYKALVDYQELSSYWEFVSMQQPQYEAYYKNLLMQAHGLRSQNADMKTLANYRERSDQGVLMDNEALANCRQLEMTTGDLLSGPIDGNAIGSLLRNNPEIQAFAVSLIADDRRYTSVRTNLLNTLRAIVKKFKSDDNRHHLIYRYIIQRYAPILVPLYDQVIEKPNPGFFGNE